MILKLEILLNLFMAKKLIILTIILGITFFPFPVSAQTTTPATGPTYIVQEGDTLWGIAARFGVSVEEIIAVNNLSNQDIFPGNEIIIPGLEGLTGTLATFAVPFGSNIRSMSRHYQMDEALIFKINHIISPAEIYAGYEMIILKDENKTEWNARAALGVGETMLEMAVTQNTNLWLIASGNGMAVPAETLPSDILFTNSGNSTIDVNGLPEIFEDIQVDPLPITQGDTAEVKVKTSGDASLVGILGGYTLHFFPYGDGYQVALQGIHAMLDQGLYPLRIDATLENQSIQSYEQMVLVKQGDFLSEPINGVEPDTLDPNITGPEDQWLFSVVETITPQKLWQGRFALPIDSQYCLRSKYGNRRSYNGGILHTFHSGVDFGVCSTSHPFDVYAPADGTVAYTGLKTVRGNVTIIDHGQGIYSGLYHQEEIYVSVGDPVTAGQLIGKMGKTGRATGVHLHWDLFVNGVQVDPLNWLNDDYPH
jgi:murein DD-endopeptidase MepM/ murein hydrolase activator NlpD